MLHTHTIQRSRKQKWSQLSKVEQPPSGPAVATTVQWLCERQTHTELQCLSHSQSIMTTSVSSFMQMVCVVAYIVICMRECLCPCIHIYIYLNIYSCCMCVCVCVRVYARVCVCVCARMLTISLRLCVDHTWPYGTALWRHTVAQMDTFGAGHILNDPPVVV